jgi:hypothetical protein
MAAHDMLAMIQRMLLRQREVAMMPRRHDALVLTDTAVGAMQAHGFEVAHRAGLHAMFDAFVLVLQAGVDLLAARVMLAPLRVGHGGARYACDQECGQHGGKFAG